MDLKERLLAAADYCDWLYEGSKHVPTDLRHSERIRGRIEDGEENTAAIVFYGGLAEVYLSLGSGVLSVLARWLRTEAKTWAGDEIHERNCSAVVCTGCAAEELADRLLKAKEKLT